MTIYTISTPTFQPPGGGLSVGDSVIVTLFGSIGRYAAGGTAVTGAGGNTVQIDGAITSPTMDGDGIVLAGDSNVVTVGATGSVYAQRRAVNLTGNGGTVNVSGQVVSSAGAAVTFANGGSILNVGASGRIQSSDNGVATLGGTLTLNNAGQIVSILQGAVNANQSGNAITNSGLMSGRYGIFILTGTGMTSIVNSGVIRGSGSFAIGTNAGVSVVNSGTIDGFGGIQATTNAVNTIQNTGYIFGRGGSAVSTTNAGDTVVNSGFMQGVNQAVTLGAGNDLYDGRLGLQFGSVLGESGDDVLFGGAGYDFLYGGDDNDQLSGGALGDYLDGGAGFDYARYDTAAGAVTASLATPAANTGEAATDSYVSIEGLIGSQFGDLLVGDGGANTLYGLGGQDGIAGGGGADTIYGGDGGDSIAGQAGNDLIYGGAGGDVLSGGAGGDVFAYSSLADGGDFIADFNAGGVRDSFDISAIFDISGYMGTTPRVGNILQVLQNGADTDVYVYNTFLFRIPNLYAPALDDTYFTFQAPP